MLPGTDKVLNTWASLASHFVGDVFDASQPFVDQNSAHLDPYVRFVSSQLYLDCHLSSESSLLLINAGKEWDADMINRAVVEGSVKYIYLMSGADDEIKSRAVEYWEILPQFAAIKRSERVKNFLDAVDDPNSAEWAPMRGMQLEDREIQRIKDAYTKQQREELIRKWSFSELAKHFAASGDEKLKHLAHLTYGYGMSSHIVHKDGDGVGMVWERCRRDEQRQTAAKLGHSARIVSDICMLSKLRLLYLLKACKQHSRTKFIGDIEKRHELLFGELQKGVNQFFQTEYESREVDSIGR